MSWRNEKTMRWEMDNDEAKVILSACRPHGQDAGDPVFAEALSQAEHDPELRQWFEAERAFDQAVSGCLGQIPVPADLKHHILAGHRIGRKPEPARKFHLPLAMAASIALTFGLGYFAGNLNQDAGEFSLADYRESMIEVVGAGIEFDVRSSRMEELTDFVALKSAPSAKNLPGSLADDSVMGCKIVSWNDRKVSLFCFRNKAGQIVHLFVADVKDSLLAGRDTTGKVIAEVNNLPTLSWEDEGYQYLLAGHTADTDLSQYY